MIYGDEKLRELIAEGVIETVPECISCASIDLRLGDNFKTPQPCQLIRLGEPVFYADWETDEFVIEPNQFVLATTLEYIKLPKNLAAYVHGRSSIGRAGLTVQNAGYVDPGFEGCITLELKNETDCPIVVRKGYRVAQLVFEEADGVSEGYKGKYNGQRKATESKMELDKDKPK